MVILRLFGGVAIDGGAPALTGRAAQRRPVALLVLLAVAQPRALSRDKLIAYLWPESDARNARNLLSQAVHALRQALGAESILSPADELRLNPQHVTSDVRQFEAALADGDRERAVELYSGPFVDGFFLGDSAGFEHWVDGERGRLRGAYVQALQDLGDDASSRNDYAAAEAWLRRLAAEDPYNSRVMLRLMEALEAAGDRAGAIRVAEVHARLLREELDAEPTPEVLALAERMRTEPRRMEPDAAKQPDGAATGPDASGEPAAEQEIPTTWPRRQRHPRSRIGAAAAALLVLSAAGYMGMRATGSGPAAAPLSEGAVEARGHILIPDFAGPADELLGRTAAELLRTSFSMSRLLYVPSDAAIRSALARMGRDGQNLQLEDARELASREGYGLIATGEIAQVGEGYVLTARLIETESGEILGRFRSSAASHDDFVRAVDGISTAMRERIGETAESIRRSVPLAQVTTPSLEALKAYTRARHLRLVEGRWDEAVPWFERAIETDSTFGLAYRALAMTLHYLGRGPDETGPLFGAAYRHRDHMTPMERVMIEEWAVMQRNRTEADGPGFYEPLIRLHEEFLELHGRHASSLNNLGHYYLQAGRLEDAIRAYEWRQSIEYSALGQSGLIRARIDAGDLEGAERDLADMRERSGDNLDWHIARAGLALARGELEESYSILEEAAARHSDQPRAETTTLEQRAMIDAALGRLERAERHMSDRIRRAESAGAPFAVLTATRDLATMLALVNPAEAPRALRLLDAAVRHNPPPDPSHDAWEHWKLAFAYGLLGEPRRGREYLEEALHSEPGLAREWDSVLGRATILQAEGRQQEAVRLVMDAIRRDPEHPDRQLLGLLADAYLDLGIPDSAMVAYERLLADRSLGPAALLWRAPWVLALPRAHRELGRLYEERGDTARAADHLARFIELWRDADPALQPQVRDAVRRLVSLRPD